MSENVRLKLDLTKLRLILKVNKPALSVSSSLENSQANISSVALPSGVIAYDIGIHDSRASSRISTTSNFLTLNSTKSYRDQHLLVNASTYGMATGNSETVLNKVMYERDWNGYRFATGMVDSWDLQTLGSIAGYTVANFSGKKTLEQGVVTSVGGNISPAIHGDSNLDKTLSGGAFATYSSDYSSGAINMGATSGGAVNTSLTSYGNIGWNGLTLAASGLQDVKAGVIIKTSTEGDRELSVKVDEKIYPLNDSINYIPLKPYGCYEVQIVSDSEALEQQKIVENHRRVFTLYPGNVAVIEPIAKPIVRLFGRLVNKEGKPLKGIRLYN